MTALFEKMATRETGRLSTSIRETAGGSLVVYPENLKYSAILRKNISRQSRFFIEFSNGDGRWLQIFRLMPVFLWRLLKILPSCNNIELYMLSTRIDGPFILVAAALARLVGRSVLLHDYRFKAGRSGRTEERLRSICSQVIYGDISALEEKDKIEPGVSFRIDFIDRLFYRRLKKERAVPKVMVYGDFSDEKTLTLVRRTHDLVKQKYPRTELILISPLETDVLVSDENSLRITCPESEKDFQTLFAASDILLLMSPGGVNRLFGFRAALAGYPVITNGFDYPVNSGGDPVIASRDSYSSLAVAITRMVDDEDYYRGFSHS
ncbi:MAG: hypothetical protein GY841_05835 [FCB group bacterium]|nr:hypothetical protein [FCB group bacterium]